MRQQRISREFYRPLIRAGVTLVMLWVIGVVFKRLPMLQELRLPKVPFSGATIAGMAISLLMVGILVGFATEFGRQLRAALPQFPESGVVVASLVYIIAIVVAYDTLSPLGQFLLNEDVWIYQLGFLALTLIPVCIGGLTLYRNADKITDLFTARITEVTAEVVTCPKCGAPNERDARFCFSCGTELVVPEKPELIACPECRVANAPGAKFCSQCGAELVPPEKPKIITCPKCGAENEPDARFCTRCGADLLPTEG